MPLNRADRIIAVGIGLMLGCLYMLLRQDSQAFDGVYFLNQVSRWPPGVDQYHLLHSSLLFSVVRPGNWIGFDSLTVGCAFSAWTMAGAMSLFYMLTRRTGIGRLSALAFTTLIAWCNPVLENATCVELYGPVMLAVLLALHAFWNESREPSRRHALLLWIGCLLLVLLHAAMALWVLALYLSLIWQVRQDGHRRNSYLIQGAGVALVLGIATFITMELNEATRNLSNRLYFSMFNQVNENPLVNLILLLAAPFRLVFKNLGLGILFVSFGIPLLQRRWAEGALMTLFGTLLFISVFTFWIEDVGNYFLPMLPVWGLCAAHAGERLLHGFPRRQGLLVLLLGLGGIALLIQIRQTPLGGTPAWNWSWVILTGYLLMFMGWQLGKASLHPTDRSAPGRWRYGIPLLPICMILVQAAQYTPRALDQSQYGAFGRSIGKLTRHHPSFVWNTCLISSVFDDNHNPLMGVWVAPMKLFSSGADDGIVYDHHPLQHFLRGAGAPSNPLTVYLDEGSMAYAREHWHTKTLADLPMELFEFEPLLLEGDLFYQLHYRDEWEARRHFLRHDPYPAEDWGGVYVQWLRPVTELPLESRKGTLHLKYWVGHPNVSPANPVTVSTSIAGETVDRTVCTAQQIVEIRAEVDLTHADLPASSRTLLVQTEPGWISPEDRHLGIGLYPVQWDPLEQPVLAGSHTVPKP